MSRTRPIIDISPEISPDTLVFPGDAPYQQQWGARIGEASPVNTSTLMLSPHTGAHADAPLHFDPAGEAIGAVALAPYIGHCRVLHAFDAGPLVFPDHLQGRLEDLPPRILIRTAVATRRDRWDPCFSALAPETVDALHRAGVQLIGIDTPSVDPADDADLLSHLRIGRYRMALLENLLLDGVECGDYELIALPLRLTLAEASPVRAILRPWPRS
ncbi:arylformamidase [Niveibacterium terrae]|uniref:arylformamidase n=1 Tax=Niveibacterium terrae TaxID=3373598 RepID=UPI003A90D81B